MMNGLFKGKVLGSEPVDNESYQQQFEQQTPFGREINFNDKILNGQQASNFFEGKLSAMQGINDYTQRVNMLTGKGDIKMNIDEKINNTVNNNSLNPFNKVNSILGGFNASGNSADKVSMMLGGNTKKGKNNINNFFSMPNTKSVDASNKINMMLGKRSENKHKNFNNMLNFGAGNRAFSGISPMKDMKSMLSMPLAKNDVGMKIRNAFSIPSDDVTIKAKNSAMEKINSSFGLMQSPAKNDNMSFLRKLGNPESVAVNRMNMGRGLSMFGDYDKDGVLNMFDCNPLNPKKQAEYHDMLYNEMGEPESVEIENTMDNEENADYSYSQPYEDMQEDNYGQYAEMPQSSDYLESQISEAKAKMDAATTPEEKRIYSSLINNLMKQAPSYAEREKTARAEAKEKWDREKYKEEKKEKEQEKINKYNLGMAQLGADYGLKSKQFEASQKDREAARLLAEKQFKWQLIRDATKEERDIRQDERQLKLDEARQASELRKDKIAFELAKAKINLERDKGDKILMGKNLELGGRTMNMVTGTGTGAGLVNAVSSQNVVTNPVNITGNIGNPMSGAALVGGVQPNFSNMMMLTGAYTPSTPLNDKVANLVGISGMSSQPQMQEQPMPMQQPMMQPQPRPMPVRQPMPMQQPMSYQEYRNSQSYRQPMQSKNINWDEMTPEEAAQYDPEYAKYLRESSGKTYRRGPYKKD